PDDREKLGGIEAAVAAGGDDDAQLAFACPPADGARADAQHGCRFRREQQPLVAADCVMVRSAHAPILAVPVQSGHQVGVVEGARHTWTSAGPAPLDGAVRTCYGSESRSRPGWRARDTARGARVNSRCHGTCWRIVDAECADDREQKPCPE